MIRERDSRLDKLLSAYHDTIANDLTVQHEANKIRTPEKARDLVNTADLYVLTVDKLELVNYMEKSIKMLLGDLDELKELLGQQKDRLEEEIKQ